MSTVLSSGELTDFFPAGEKLVLSLLQFNISLFHAKLCPLTLSLNHENICPVPSYQMNNIHCRNTCSVLYLYESHAFTFP